ncbi:MAG: hypothetical protein CTY29_08000 [Methylobacter sp.]|nr:MAG: hypothetical protein CTY29_08000 [Methylobacter sp.]
MDADRLSYSCDAGPAKTNSFGEQYFYNLNRSSFDKISAQALFDAKFAEPLFTPDMLNVIIGTDSGLLPQYLQHKGLAKGSRYIFVEPPEILAQLEAAGLLTGLDEAIACISMESWSTQSEAFKIGDYFYINATKLLNSIGAEDDFIHQYAELSWHMNEIMSTEHWKHSMSLGNESFTAMQIYNMPDNQRPAKLLEKLFDGKTAVLLAGGPSLDEALPWVIENRQKIAVFAVSRICRQLLQHEIEPDFIFSVDPTDLSFDISKEMLNFSDKPIFVYAYHAIPQLVSQWHGLGFYLGNRFPWKTDLNEANLEGSGPTVTNTALTTAYYMGFKRIILAGVDLCFTQEGYTHAKGSDEHLAGPRFNLTALQVETNAGFLAPTSCDFAAAIESLSLQAKAITAKDCRLISCSGNAARVESVDYIPLADIILDNQTPDVHATVTQVLAKQTDQTDADKVLAELKRVRFQMQAIKDLSETALTINAQMYTADGLIADYKDKKKLDQIEKKLKRTYKLYAKLVKRFGIRSFIKITKPFDNTDWTAEEAKALCQVYYEAYRDGANKLLLLLDAGIAKFKARQEEYSSTPDWQVLLTQWRKDKSFARAKIWRRLHPDSTLPEAIVKEFEELEQQLASVLSNQQTKHFARAKTHSNVGFLKKRAILLFSHKKCAELESLLNALDQHDPEVVKPYRYLIEGYIAELKHDHEAALTAYHSLINMNEPWLLEEVLQRIAAISLGRAEQEQANLALQCLAQVNPSYLPFYAEAQRISGELLPAIDSYNAYITQFPDDVLAQIKLAMLYMENKVFDAARVMLDFILAKQPDSEAARKLKKQLPSAA